VPISLVITELDVGGAERTLVALAGGLDPKRWRPSVVALGPDAPLAEPIRSQGIPLECLGVDSRRPVQAVARLAGALRRQAPWLVQSFLFHANVASRLAAPWAGRPWLLGGLRVAEREKRWHVQLDRLTAGLALGSVCVSQGVLAFSRDVAGIPEERLTVIANSVDPGPYDQTSALPRAAIGVPADAHLALFVGRLTPQKGLPVLLDAAARVAAARGDWHLALVGDGPERDRLLERTQSSPILAERVHWLGRRDDIPALLKSADLLVLPSLWEGMPNVVLEAMAARRAVVATAVEGTTDLVVPGQTGWLVPPGDPGSLAGALLDAAADPDRLRRFGDAGRARVESHYTIPRMVEAYQNLWACVLGLSVEP
jgi:starch synthase (maltosyl-transferring)